MSKSDAIDFPSLQLLKEAAHKRRCRFIAHRDHNSIAVFSELLRSQTGPYFATLTPNSAKEQRQCLIFAKRVVRITIQPTLAGLCGSNDRMRGSVRVLAGMPIWRAITAKCDAALLARAQMDPGRTNFHALFAFAAVRLFN
jgi:hypothetical protein